jgi:hypothetical protein
MQFILDHQLTLTNLDPATKRHPPGKDRAVIHDYVNTHVDVLEATARAR